MKTFLKKNFKKTCFWEYLFLEISHYQSLYLQGVYNYKLHRSLWVSEGSRTLVKRSFLIEKNELQSERTELQKRKATFNIKTI